MKNSTEILLGVTGSIACYKAADLASKLVQNGYSVHVVMTAAAQKFIAPLTFQTITCRKVITEMFPQDYEVEEGHIPLARLCRLILIAPATANIIGKLANGIADDYLTTAVMASKAPVVIAPAMNDVMYNNPVLQKNIKALKSIGYDFIEPEKGRLACGTEGKGRLASVEVIMDRIDKVRIKN
ncbi:MAG: phosphopantothenoylcysteine decarboxylase [Planctomycetes bacterium]|nr:phosphopantothenoylcysteine decarboxylase [Planctomycetota bacterium]